MNLIIRKAAFSDAADMANIHMRSWEAAYEGIIPAQTIAEKNAGRPAMWEKTLSGEHNDYIALSGGTAVGLMGIHPSHDADGPDIGELGAIYLHPDFFGKGYGREMVGFAIKTLIQQGFSAVTLWVLEDNLRARRFYKKCGFAFDGTQKDMVIGKPLIAIRYRKEI
jgi:RimJ/RimL family protein N-acetyltransferase